MNVLIVEDDPATGELIAATLRGFAHRIEVAQTFRQAKELILKVVFNLVLLDLRLTDSTPETSLERIPELRQIGTKVVVLTGVETEALSGLSLSAADGVFYKGQPDLKQKLRELCAA